MERYGKLEDSNFKDFKDRTYENGILTVRLNSWNEFLSIIRIFSDNKSDYYWRGHRNEKWELKSFLDREIVKRNIIPHISRRQDKLNEILLKFKERLQELSTIHIDTNNENEIWAIGQHYGLPTPLLDWTECPYIAAFMAFRIKNTEDQSTYIVIYALNLVLKTLISVNKLKKNKSGKIITPITTSKDRFVEFLDLIKTSDKFQNKRLKRQQGRFTKAMNGVDIKTNIYDFSRKRKNLVAAKKVIIAEIFIPAKERDNCLNYLINKKNITHGSLFPDYPGVVEICKSDLNIE